MGRTITDVHLRQTVAPSNLNRNNTGSPTPATDGGVRRARVSSQACKRAVRVEFERTLDESALGGRTLPAGGAIAEPVTTVAAEWRDQASALATTVRKAGHLAEDEPHKTPTQLPPQRVSAAWAAREGGTK